jgi:phosphoribosyl 1,2-cyclic phosphodiesterase
MTRGTEGGLRDQTRPEAVETIEPNTLLRVRHLEVEAFTIPHDTRDPVAYRVGAGGTWAGVITDLGKPTSLVREKLKSLSVAVLEFNHDVELLMEGSYPWALKQRIRSSHGHLSNDQAAELLHDGLGEGLRHLVLAHLSEENNRPTKAMAAALRALADRGATGQATVTAASQDAPHRVAPVRVHDW